MKGFFIFSVLLFLQFGTPAFADQTVIDKFNASKTVFWNDLYPTGGHTLYCNQPFAGHAGLDVEHVYATSWMGQHLGCGNRDQCRVHPTNGTRFNHMEADLHNLYSAMAGLNRTRSNNTFGEIPGEARSLLACDFESDNVTPKQPDVDIAFINAKTRLTITIACGGMVVILFGASSPETASFQFGDIEVSATGIGAVIMTTSVYQS
jgi:hypothetical protein